MNPGFAPAKINLALHVTGQRADGYHLLDSLVVFADLSDRLAFRPAKARSLTVTGRFAAGVPTGPGNLIWKAADLLDPAAGIAITLDKALPHGAGLGGGSSDAAATLRTLSALWGRPLPDSAALLGLGADLPVCLHGRAVRMRGIGERLEPLPPLPPLSLLLVNPGRPVSTPACFGALAERRNPPMEDPAWSDATGFVDWLARQRNDLEPPALSLVPEIGDCLAALRTLPGCKLARMSGSGATCFGLFDPGLAERAEKALRGANPSWWVGAAAILT